MLSIGGEGVAVEQVKFSSAVHATVSNAFKQPEWHADAYNKYNQCTTAVEAAAPLRSTAEFCLWQYTETMH